MSEPTGARRYGVGGGDAYYDAVKYGGYEGTREQFGRDQAEFAQNAAAVAEAKEAVEQDAEEVRSTKEEFVNTTVTDAIAAVQQEGADQVEAVTEKGEEVSQQVEVVGTQWKDEVANEGRSRVQAVEQAGTTQVQNVNDAGTTQVGNVNQAGEDQVDAVEQAGADQVQAVTDEGTTQVGNVTGEGNTQVQRVQDKGDEVLNSIPSDYTELTEDVDNLKESMTQLDSRTVGVTEINGYLRADNKWGQSNPVASSISLLIEVTPSTRYLIRSTNTCYGAFLKTVPDGNFWANNTDMSAHYATGSGRTQFAASTAAGSVPSDAKYLVISWKVNGNNWSPTTLTIDGYNYLTALIENIYKRTYNRNRNCLAYVSGNALEWSENEGGDCYLTILEGSDGIVIREVDHATYQVLISKASFLSAASASQVVTVTNGIVSGKAFAFFYDFEDSTLKVDTPQSAALYKDTVILFAHYYNSITCGALIDNQNIKALKTIQNESPIYLNSEIEDTVGKMLTASTEKCMLIAFTTDNHYGASDGKNWNDTINSIKTINNKYKLDVVIDGGDMINGDETVANAKERLSGMIADMDIKNVKSYAAVGNHDDNSFTATPQVLIPQADLYALFGRPFSTNYDVLNGEKVYGYKDFDSLGIRFIVLDSRLGDTRVGDDPLNWGFDTDQISWVENVALDTDYQVVFFSHCGLTKEYSVGNYQPVNGDVLRGKIETFIGNGGTVIGFFHGHTHWDFIGQKSETNGFHEVSTGCSRVQNYTPSYSPDGATVPTRENGTTSQELIDIICIKPDSREVDMIRFGAGSDRTFTY